MKNSFALASKLMTKQRKIVPTFKNSNTRIIEEPK